jgi:hypothetical protein
MAFDVNEIELFLACAPASCNLPSSFEGRTRRRHKIKYMIVAKGGGKRRRIL